MNANFISKLNFTAELEHKIISTQNGKGKVLIADKHQYHQDTKKKGKSKVWRCKHRNKGCRGSVKFNRGKLRYRYRKHVCMPKEHIKLVKDIRKRLLQKAIESPKARYRHIYEEELEW